MRSVVDRIEPYRMRSWPQTGLARGKVSFLKARLDYNINRRANLFSGINNFQNVNELNNGTKSCEQRSGTNIALSQVGSSTNNVKDRCCNNRPQLADRRSSDWTVVVGCGRRRSNCWGTSWLIGPCERPRPEIVLQTQCYQSRPGVGWSNQPHLSATGCSDRALNGMEIKRTWTNWSQTQHAHIHVEENDQHKGIGSLESSAKLGSK